MLHRCCWRFIFAMASFFVVDHFNSPPEDKGNYQNVPCIHGMFAKEPSIVRGRV